MINKHKFGTGRIWSPAILLPLIALSLMAFEMKSKNVIQESLAIIMAIQESRVNATSQNLESEPAEYEFSAGRAALEPLVPEQQLKDNKKDPNQLDTLISGKRLVIRDTTRYDSSFISGLKSNLGYETIQVFDDSFFYTYRPNTKPDTLITFEYTIPTNLEQNKEILFSAVSDHKPYTLILKRTNFTNIEYQLRQDEKAIKSGTAILQCSFYFGAEVQDDGNGKTIYLRQYIDNERCGAVLKVEIDSARIATISWCEDNKSNKYINLPIFRKE